MDTRDTLIDDKTITNLLMKFVQRGISSNKKHGNTISNVEKSTKQWVVEALEEAMDMCVYLERLLEKLEKEEQS
tara:strand:- start:872 stop:1093 length:222 start_codon:yes stop_codon:yes gene_type:complete